MGVPLEKACCTELMNRLSAHIVFIVFDVFSVLAVFYVMREVSAIKSLVASGADTISYQSMFSAGLLLFVVPVVHLSGVLPLADKYNAVLNSMLVVVFVGLFVVAVVVSIDIESFLADEGYSYCENLTEQMTFSEFRVFVRPGMECGV